MSWSLLVAAVEMMPVVVLAVFSIIQANRYLQQVTR
jgi:heme exporter protein D